MVPKKLPAGFFETETRVIFAVINEQMVSLNGFVKKTRKTPRRELGLALKRKKEITS